jgi:hypothetical protein
MEYQITQSEVKKLHKIFSRLVTQSQYHEDNIKTIFKILREELEKEFIDDSFTTMDDFVVECLYDSLKSIIFRKGIRDLLDGKYKFCDDDKPNDPILSQSVVRSDQEILISIETELKKISRTIVPEIGSNR